MPHLPDAPFPLGPWTVDPVANEIRRGAEVIRLEPKATAVLVHLAKRAGEVVTREALLDAVWPGLVVTDASLTRCVSQLRQALGDDARTLIETIPTVGYRLRVGSDPEPSEVSHPASGDETGASQRGVALAGLAVIGLAALALWAASRRGAADASILVEYRVEVEGTVRDAVVTYTGSDGRRVADSAATFPYVRAVLVGDQTAGAYRLRVEGQATEAALVLEAVARRGGAVLAEHRTTSTVAADTAQAFRAAAWIQFADE